MAAQYSTRPGNYDMRSTVGDAERIRGWSGGSSHLRHFQGTLIVHNAAAETARAGLLKQLLGIRPVRRQRGDKPIEPTLVLDEPLDKNVVFRIFHCALLPDRPSAIEHLLTGY
jgi:hypothetical protein